MARLLPASAVRNEAMALKTYQTSSAFFDLAVAAPSMKAAAEAWGSRTNVFTQGFANEIRDPAIVAATMAKPGVVLRRNCVTVHPNWCQSIHKTMNSSLFSPAKTKLGTKLAPRWLAKVADGEDRRPA